MRNKIVLQPLSPTTDAGGGQAVSFSGSNITVWAKVENTGGQEGVFGDQIRATSNYKFTIRYISAITAKYRISYNSKLFNIENIRSIYEGKERYQEISAKEGVAT